MKCTFLTGLGALLLSACQPDTAVATAATEPAAVVVEPATPARRRYEGTYHDTACALTIRIARRDTSYFFACDSVRGPVEVWQNDDATGFTFRGLKSFDPDTDDISCVWEDSVLLIQNAGNSMNEYTRFRGCDEKFLELRRQ